MDYHGVEICRQAIAEFCRRHHIRRLSLFGSILRDDFRPDSDIDVLVEFEPGRVPGLLRMAGLEIELSDILGRKADVRTPTLKIRVWPAADKRGRQRQPRRLRQRATNPIPFDRLAQTAR